MPESSSRPIDSIPLSVLDVAQVVEGSSVEQALRNSIGLARHVEELGYSRHWVAEHHNLPGVASSATSVLMAHLAAATSSIRIGAGGVMLPNHSPLVIAEQFGTLEALHPGRIDLGIGRAPGTDPSTARALRRGLDQGGDDLPELLGELVGFFTGKFPDGHPFQKIVAQPGFGHVPELWLLGSSGYSAQLSGYLGLPFSFAHHFSAQNTLGALELYRQSFRPSSVLKEPHVMVAVMVICADDKEEADRVAASSRLSYVLRFKGPGSRLPSIEDGLAYEYSDTERQLVDDRDASQAIGDPKAVRERLEAIVQATRADEIMVTTPAFDERDRLHSYELVAEIARLTKRTSVV